MSDQTPIQTPMSALRACLAVLTPLSAADRLEVVTTLSTMVEMDAPLSERLVRWKKEAEEEGDRKFGRSAQKPSPKGRIPRKPSAENQKAEREVLKYLKMGPKRQQMLADLLQMDRKKMSYVLGKLARSGLIVATGKTTARIYSLPEEPSP